MVPFEGCTLQYYLAPEMTLTPCQNWEKATPLESRGLSFSTLATQPFLSLGMALCMRVTPQLQVYVCIDARGVTNGAPGRGDKHHI